MLTILLLQRFLVSLHNTDDLIMNGAHLQISAVPGTKRKHTKRTIAQSELDVCKKIGWLTRWERMLERFRRADLGMA
jgi:hypothetical protein